jgi:hypothetical protein
MWKQAILQREGDESNEILVAWDFVLSAAVEG